MGVSGRRARSRSHANHGDLSHGIEVTHLLRHRPADHVGSPDRCRRGAGAGAAAHRVLLDRARSRRPIGRHLRRRGPHDGPGRHRYARPRQFDGAVGRAFPAPLPGRDDEGRRRLHHQRSVDGHRPPQRLRRDDAGVPQGPPDRSVLLHLAPDGHRRHRLRPGRDRRVHGRPLHPVPQAVRGGQGQPHHDGDDPRQYADAGRHHRRRIFARQLQRRRRRTPRPHDGRVRPRRLGDAEPAHLRYVAGGRHVRDRQAAEGLVDQHHAHRRLRYSDRPRGAA